MEVTCQLRLDQLTKSGQAQIQVTCCWDGQRPQVRRGPEVPAQALGYLQQTASRASNLLCFLNTL